MQENITRNPRFPETRRESDRKPGIFDNRADLHAIKTAHPPNRSMTRASDYIGFPSGPPESARYAKPRAPVAVWAASKRPRGGQGICQWLRSAAPPGLRCGAPEAKFRPPHRDGRTVSGMGKPVAPVFQGFHPGSVEICAARILARALTWSRAASNGLDRQSFVATTMTSVDRPSSKSSRP